MAEAKLGLELIVYGGRQSHDLLGVLTEIAEVGYAGFEGGGLFEEPGLAALKGAMDETGLELAAMHHGYGDMADPNRVARLIEDLQECDSQYLICSGVAPGEGLAQYEQAAETFNQVGAACRDAALTFCYHNHAFEFEAHGGVKGIHRLCELTDPELVKLCIDVYWVTIGGEKPDEFIRRYANRAGFYHFKDGAPGSFVELGQGTVDLVGSAQAATELGADWIVCEQDSTQLEPRASIAESMAYLRKLGL